MGVTYTRGTDLERVRARRAPLTTGELLLLLTSAVVMLAIALAYSGRVRAEAVRAVGAPAPANLNSTEVTEVAGVTERVLAAVFAYPADRAFAAKKLNAFLDPGAASGARVDIANVGALTRIPVAAADIDKDRSLVVLRERLDAARKSAVEAKRDAPVTIPLLTSADVAELKPLVSVRTRAEFTSAVMWCALAMLLSFHLVSLVWRWRGLPGDRVLLAIAHLLVGIGFVVILSRPDPIRDTLLIARFTEGIVIGAVVLAALSFVNLDRPALRELTYLPLAAALGLSVLLLFFGSGPGSSSARINLGPIQPIEAIRLLLALFLAGYFARRWEVLRHVRAETVRERTLPSWMNLPRLVHVLPVVTGVAAALVLFFLQRDLGPALLLALMFLAIFAVARGGAWLAGAGVAGLVAGFGVGYLLNISGTLATRVSMWHSPWDNAVRGGDQVAHGLWGLAAGATSGTGLGLGSPRFVPEGHTDLVLAAIGEELGFVGLLIVAAAFVLLAWRGFDIARRASSDYRFFLAVALTLALVIPVLVMAAGLLGVLPLTGVVTPFLSYGGSAMVANFAALGLLVAIDRDRRDAADLAPFRVPIRWLGGALGASAVAMLVIAGNVQAVRADEYLVRPQMSVQADGGRRFQYNPRVFEALRAIPRGTIYDRTGLPLASGDRAVVTKAANIYAALGKKLEDACPSPAERCYPAGPAFFHVLGDANTRTNWSAPNSSYVERDAEDLLRGFDDRATTVATTDAEGRSSVAVRRDFTPIVSLVRHRWEPAHPAVQAMLAKSRDIRVTIDARLQLAVASILQRATASAGSGRGAAVVLDADTGEILASVSYPWIAGLPDSRTSGLPDSRTPGFSNSRTDPALDRARYGLYPPGSTFKIITAAAALREDPKASDREFVCQRFPAGRIGTRIPGFGPPIYDDVHDVKEHGEIGMHDAIVRSCNAYFAQLAVALGSDVLARTAAAAGITLNTSRSVERIKANLPHAGYGQGEVVATPLRLARVAAAIGTDGIIREAPVVMGSEPIQTTFVTPAAAQMLASDLRDAVVGGTGRALSGHPLRIAGKTGTAEVDEAASHAWFVGFAPFGASKQRIAFAVVLENAGYGGQAAAAVAGQIANAASQLGLIK